MCLVTQVLLHLGTYHGKNWQGSKRPDAGCYASLSTTDGFGRKLTNADF